MATRHNGDTKTMSFAEKMAKKGLVNTKIDVPEDATRFDFEKPGDNVVGTVQFLGKYGKYESLMLLLTEADTKATLIIWPRTVLATKLQNARVKKGDLIGIEYKGEVQGESYTYQDYELYVQKSKADDNLPF